jgi:ubiquinone/menaquinone biosynthesis C-methylase UbiE
MSASETERIRELYDRDAARYDRSMAFFERLLFKDAREWVCGQAAGDVLEIAVGTGLNLPYYDERIRLTGIDLSPQMVALARRRVGDLGRAADLLVGDATRLTFGDATFDTVVCTFSLCTIPDDGAAVTEARRVLRQGGTFVYAEHVASSRRRVRAVQQLLDPLAVRFQGDHQVRIPRRHLQRGFVLERVERCSLGIVERGVARRVED